MSRRAWPLPGRGLARAGRSAFRSAQARADGGDLEITARVRSALVLDPALRNEHIHIATFRRTVRLSGFVPSCDQKQQAGLLAAAIAGVAAVRNLLAVRAPRGLPA